MVHTRLNEKESNPNPHINFITALSAYGTADQEDARQFLRALAAQVRPVMKAHGFTVNSLEEYEFNHVFAGRNWNNGETIELVLRRPEGSFYPTSWLLSTFCHELAHIKHMNHGPSFQALWRRLRAEVRALQDKGYFGDGYWSAGIRLADSAVITGTRDSTDDFPEYMCGGAQTRTRPSSLRPRKSRHPPKIVPSNRTGRQTAKRRKAGSRVMSKYAFSGEGSTLNEGDSDQKGKGTGFGKRANSKKAREERALAVEKRIQMLQAQSSQASSTSHPSSPSPVFHPESENSESDDDIDVTPETDSDRRKALLDAEEGDVQGLKVGPTAWKEYDGDFSFTAKGREDVIEISDTEELDCDIPAPSGSTFVSGSGPAASSRKGKRKADETFIEANLPIKQPKSLSTNTLTSSGGNKLGPGKLVSDLPSK